MSLAAETGISKRGRDDRSGPPLYRLVVKTLQSEIVQGVYPVGTQLPSEAALMQRFSISRHTVREALRYLREAGMVKSHQGLGTIVQRPGGDRGYVHQINTIADLFPTNVETRYDPIDGTLAPLPEDKGFALGDERRKWLRIQGHRFRPGSATPFNEVETYVAARFAGVGRVIAPHSGSIYAVLETIYGETIVEVEQVITTFIADGTAGAAIGLEKGTFGILVRRTYRIRSDDDIALLSLNRYPPNEFSYAMTLRRVRD
ncbi:GntR family transcriptional regulator [Sphingomonas profundi]|uniref:GntR family transcriptional regulator n=1 Tax=Alterirhizorhabdus profundi TaxID=2681549 RepID=UPI0012E7A992|nr:GntR family transcriptional regulator [Sphingomonas profundi]